jgi:O-antigen/teichoic acid export membrane protein
LTRVGLSLFGTRAGAALVGFFANIYLAGELGPLEYGRYATAIAVLTFAGLFVDLGYFSAGARLLSASDDTGEQRSLLGAVLLTAVPLSLALVGLTAGLALVVDRVFADQIGGILLALAVTAPAAFVPLLLEQILKGVGRMDLLSRWTAASRILFVVGLLAGAATGRLNATWAALAYTVSTLAGSVLVIPPLRPQFGHLRAFLTRLAAEQRVFGWPLYVGRLANLASLNSDRLLLAYFQNATAVGFYNLAKSFAGAITMFSQSVVASEFRSFAARRPVSRALLRWNRIGMAVVGAGTVGGVYLVVRFYLGPAYAIVPLLTLAAVAATAFQGLYQPYNSWLLANGLGLELRQFLVRNAVVNLAANAALIPSLGVWGATLASGVGMAAYLVQARHYYRRELRPAAA